MQKRPVNKQTLLIFFSKRLIPSGGLNKEFKVTANRKKIMKIGKPSPVLFSLKYQAENKTKGTIHKVLPSFNVAATSTDLSPNTEAAPITDAVSWIARDTQDPNWSSVNPSHDPKKGKIITATPFNIKIIDRAGSNSSGLALITGATEAIAVPPHIAVPEASK